MARSWWYVRIASPSEPEADLLAEGLVASGATSVQQEPGGIVTYLPDEGEGDTRIDELRRTLESIAGRALELTCERRADEDWTREWRRGLDARRVGERLILTPTWIEPAAQPGDIVIAIDPQMAFGTGEHATTRGVLQLLEGVVTPGMRVLDVGTGSAVLAIVAAKLGAAHVLAAESDPDALINAAENVARNGVEGTVELCEALVDGAWLARHADPPFDLIVANVLSSVLRPLLPAFHAALRPAGALILSGILREEAAGMQESASGAGLSLGGEVREEEWWTALLRRP